MPGNGLNPRAPLPRTAGKSSVNMDLSALPVPKAILARLVPGAVLAQQAPEVIPERLVLRGPDFPLVSSSCGLGLRTISPDLWNRFVIGGGGDYTVGSSGGKAAHTLTVAEMPAHSHTYSRPSSVASVENGNFVKYTSISTASTSTVGLNQPHNNLPPYYALCYIMKT